MPNHQQHRGPNPEDAALFTKSSRLTLLAALDEAAFLLDRGYTTDSVLDVVSRRHALRVRQRTALQRSMCSTTQMQIRRQRRMDTQSVSNQRVEIDGFNQIITTEVALSEGLLLRGRDGAFRDLAGLRGSYHPVEETELALSLIGQSLARMRVAGARFYLDQPVSNSGRLKQRIAQHAEAWPFALEIEVVRNPDRELDGKSLVISSDAAVLDRATSWFNLTEVLLEQHPIRTWVMDLSMEAPNAGPTA